ncbi:putative clathrin assembly protein [Tanacetum coccineum]|uniref:Clathrin assembly protein n=1 Tax=Tanacetum coccineum TaxID=301880 RepID=A0ABQ4Z1B8_9ASTR
MALDVAGEEVVGPGGAEMVVNVSNGMPCLGFLRLKLRKASDPIIYVQRTGELDTPKLFGQLSALQQFLYSVLGCGVSHKGASEHNFVASESVKVYKAISEGTQNSVDKCFEKKRYDAAIAMYIYKRAVMQIKVTTLLDTLLQHMGNVKKSVAERTRHQRQYDRRVNKRQLQTQESKIDTGKALDADLVDT